MRPACQGRLPPGLPPRDDCGKARGRARRPRSWSIDNPTRGAPHAHPPVPRHRPRLRGRDPPPRQPARRRRSPRTCSGTRRSRRSPAFAVSASRPDRRPGATDDHRMHAGFRAMAPILAAYAPFALVVGASVATSADAVVRVGRHLAGVRRCGPGRRARRPRPRRRLDAGRRHRAADQRAAGGVRRGDGAGVARGAHAAAGRGRGDADRRPLGAGPGPRPRRPGVLPRRRPRALPRLADDGHRRRARRHPDRRRPGGRPAAAAHARRRRRAAAAPPPSAAAIAAAVVTAVVTSAADVGTALLLAAATGTAAGLLAERTR